MERSIGFPGDVIACIEEYEPGHNTFDDDGLIRHTVVGAAKIDKGARIASIMDPKSVPVPDTDDIVIGMVVAVMSSMFAVSIKFINGKPVTSGVECICSTRNMRKKTIAILDDVVVLKVLSRLNGTIHAAIGERNLGVLFTKCRKCGERVIPSRDGVKCAECGWFDERKLSSDFGNLSALSV